MYHEAEITDNDTFWSACAHPINFMPNCATQKCKLFQLHWCFERVTSAESSQPGYSWQQPVMTCKQQTRSTSKHQKRELTIVVSVEQLHRQSGQLLGAVCGLFLTAAFHALRVRLSGSRWVNGAVPDGWPRPPARQARARTRTAQGRKIKLNFSRAFPKFLFSLSRHKKEIDVLYTYTSSLIMN